MIFAFLEDGTVDVLANENAATVHSEPIDVESRVVVFYADDGTWLEPRFTRPTRRRFFGFVLEQGQFDLVRNPAGDREVDSFDVAVNEAVFVNPNPYFKTLQEICEYVRARRAAR